MKNVIIFLFILLSNQVFSQTSYNIITEGNYKSCFSKDNRAPIYIAYKLQKQSKSDSINYRFYNCIPNLPNLNSEVRQYYESKIKRISRKDSILIITGSIYGSNKLPNNEAYIPDYCWTVVESLTTKKIYFSFIIKNDAKCEYIETSISELEYRLKYKLPLKR